MSIGTRVRVLREERGINQRELGEQAGLTQATISRIESGQVEQLRSDALRRLADALRVTVDYLVGRTDDIEAGDRVEADPDARLLLELYGSLAPESRSLLVDFAWFLQLSEEINLEELARLRNLLRDDGGSEAMDRQIAILRTLAKLSGPSNPMDET